MKTILHFKDNFKVIEQYLSTLVKTILLFIASLPSKTMIKSTNQF